MDEKKFEIGDKVRILVDTVPVGYDKRSYPVPKNEIRVVTRCARSFYDQSTVYVLNSVHHELEGIGFRENEIEKV